MGYIRNRLETGYNNMDVNNQSQDLNQNQTNEKLSYVPHSPYYEPVHPPQFYKDE